MLTTTAARSAGMILLATLLTVLAKPTRAELVSADDTGFEIRLELSVALDPPAAFARFTDDVHAWWNGAHTYSGDAARLTLDATCFCERWDGNVVRHLEIGQFMPGIRLRLLGGLGPLQGLPLQGVMDITFSAAEDAPATTVVLSYAVRGSGLASWAAPVHGVLEEQFTRFGAYSAGQ